jgi:hypothetical protein
MPDKGIKQSKVLPKDLPPMTLDGKYIIRYRIVTEDKKQFSVWSPKFTLSSVSMSSLLEKTPITYNIRSSINKEEKNIMTLSWTIPPNVPLPNDYDVYVRWGIAKTINVSTVSSSGTTITINTSSAHGLGSGQKVTIYGITLNNGLFNGTYSVTVVDSDTFTFTAATSQTVSNTSATSGSVYPYLKFYITNKQRTNGSLVKVTTSTVHGLSMGDDIYITGLGTTYNGAYTVTSVPSTATFTYISFGDNLASTAVTANTAYAQSIIYLNTLNGNWTLPSEVKTTNSTIFTTSVPTSYIPTTGIKNIKFVKFRVQVATTQKYPTSTIAKLFEVLSSTEIDSVVG